MGQALTGGWAAASSKPHRMRVIRVGGGNSRLGDAHNEEREKREGRKLACWDTALLALYEYTRRNFCPLRGVRHMGHSRTVVRAVLAQPAHTHRCPQGMAT